MELPNIGRHCAHTDCKLLDYLPIKCQNCQNYYCSDHFKPNQHSCINLPPSEDVRVPICPICSAPVPFSRGEDPNIRMDQHISNDCTPAPKTTSSKSFNSCSFGKCKNRVAVQILCSGCGKNYCIKHRLGYDHLCDQIQKDKNQSNNKKYDLLPSSAISALSTSFSNLTTSSSSSSPGTTATRSSTSNSRSKNMNKKVKNSWVGKLFK
ncbi:hypothetical protein Glove_320g55 [Diversispora epigaea]|uniref:AN1-type domain-containing protein n=1 Tax=Diversispora epigaea TaxID=1348612 RepID=A0A397HNM5_9GLOM|nr:hypothetical protein Glove_320g55 [Diversispora epigaea]